MKASVCALLILLASANHSLAVDFQPGEYRIESSLPAYAMGQSKQVIDKRCKQINKIGWKALSKPECELLSANEIDNKLSYEIKCSGKEIGDQKLRIDLTVYKDHFDGDVWFSEKDKMVIVGKKVNSCSEEGNLTTHNDPEESNETFADYVKKKYQDVDMDITHSDVVLTKDGRSGSFSLSGNIIPRKKPEIDLSTKPNREVRARGIAKAFLEDEQQALFDLKDMNEVKESNISTEAMPRGEYTRINYKRFINGIEVEGAGIHIDIGPSENITSVGAGLVPIPTAAYDATTKTTLSEKDIISIVEADHNEQDIKQYPKDAIIKTFKKTVIASEPYVIWDVFYRYVYRINAFTGEIMSKRSLRFN